MVVRVLGEEHTNKRIKHQQNTRRQRERDKKFGLFQTVPRTKKKGDWLFQLLTSAFFFHGQAAMTTKRRRRDFPCVFRRPSGTHSINTNRQGKTNRPPPVFEKLGTLRNRQKRERLHPPNENKKKKKTHTHKIRPCVHTQGVRRSRYPLVNSQGQCLLVCV